MPRVPNVQVLRCRYFRPFIGEPRQFSHVDGERTETLHYVFITLYRAPAWLWINWRRLPEHYNDSLMCGKYRELLIFTLIVSLSIRKYSTAPI